MGAVKMPVANRKTPVSRQNENCWDSSGLDPTMTGAQYGATGFAPLTSEVAAGWVKDNVLESPRSRTE